MEPPPLPTQSGRFRLRVQILPSSDAYNLNAAPLRQFTIVKTSTLALPDLSLQQLCDEVVKRFRAIYPGESLFAIEKPQDSYGSDLYLGDHVRDVFEDNEIFRVIKGATIRASVEPHRARSQSVQPASYFQYGSAGGGKRTHGLSDTGDLLRGHKRQRVIANDPDRPIRSSERDTVDQEVQPEQENSETIIIQNSQENHPLGGIGQGVNVVSQGVNVVSQGVNVVSQGVNVVSQGVNVVSQGVNVVSQGVNVVSQGVNVVSQGSSNLQLPYSTKALECDSVHRGDPNVIAKAPAPPEYIPSRPATVMGDVVVSSDSDSEPPRQRCASRTKRKPVLIEDFSELDRGQSTSTAVTTPLSVLQQSTHQSPVADSKKLRRPTIRAAKNDSEEPRRKRMSPRQNIYEDIETNPEQQRATAVSQAISSTLVNSYKWRKFTSATTPGSDKSSSPLRGSSSTQGNNLKTSARRSLDRVQISAREQIQKESLAKRQVEQERLRIASEIEKQRLEAEDKQRNLYLKLRSEQVAAEKSRQELEAKMATETGARRQKVAPTKFIDEKLVRSVEKSISHMETIVNLPKGKDPKLNELKHASAENSTTAGPKMNAQQNTENDLKKQPVDVSRPEKNTKMQNIEALQATVRRAASASLKAPPGDADGSPVRLTPQIHAITLQSTSNNVETRNTQNSCTPFIPRRRPPRLNPAIPHPSKLIEGSLVTRSSPNVDLEDQIPMPSQLKRKVSFVDQAPPSAHRSSSVSSVLKQTTLIPPHLAFTDMKSTPKHLTIVRKTKSMKSSKGKAKAVESPAKPPTPIVVISDDEESVRSRNNFKFQQEGFRGAHNPGPTHRSPDATQAPNPPKSTAIRDIRAVNAIVRELPSLNERVTQKITANSISPTKASSSSKDHNNRKEGTNFLAKQSPPYVLSNLSVATPPKNVTPMLQRASLARSFNSPKTKEVFEHPGSSKSKSDGAQSYKENENYLGEDGISHGSQSTGERDNPRSDVSRLTSNGDDRLSDLQQEKSNTSDDGEEDESDVSGIPVTSPTVQINLSNKNGQEGQMQLSSEKESGGSNSPEEELDSRGINSEHDSAGEELEDSSDFTQAQIDNQLLTQSFGTSDLFERQSKLPKPDQHSLSAFREVRSSQIEGAGRPSLKRMNEEAQRNKLSRMELQNQHTGKMTATETSVLPNDMTEVSSDESSSSSSDHESSDKKSKKTDWTKLGKTFGVRKA